MVPLKNKTGKSLVEAFDHIFKQDERIPERLQTDKGTEFTNRQFQKFLESKHVDHFVTYSETKAQIVERFNGTIKGRMWQYFTQVNHYRYLDVLDDLVKSYNSSKHRSIGTAPNLVTQANAQNVWRYFYGDNFVKRVKRMHFKFKVGDQVRISKERGIFDTGSADVDGVTGSADGPASLMKFKENIWDDPEGEGDTGSLEEEELVAGLLAAPLWLCCLRFGILRLTNGKGAQISPCITFAYNEMSEKTPTGRSVIAFILFWGSRFKTGLNWFFKNNIGGWGVPHIKTVFLQEKLDGQE